MSGAIGTWDQVFATAAPEIGALALQARALILHLHPAAVETSRPGDGATTFGLGPAKMKEGYAYLAPQRAWLNLGFYHGADLPDPKGLLDGTGRALRHVKLRKLSDLGPGIEALLREAIALQARRLGRAD